MMGKDLPPPPTKGKSAAPDTSVNVCKLFDTVVSSAMDGCYDSLVRLKMKEHVKNATKHKPR